MTDPLKHLLRDAFTRMPRRYLGLLASGVITPAEYALLSAIADRTLSWKRLWEKLSFTELQRATGLSRQKVSDAVRSLETGGLIVRKKAGRSYAYALVPEGVESAYLLDNSSVDNAKTSVNSVDRYRSTELTDNANPSLYKYKENIKKGLKGVEKGLSHYAETGCNRCRGTGWGPDDDESGVYRCPCTLRALS